MNGEIDNTVTFDCTFGTKRTTQRAKKQNFQFLYGGFMKQGAKITCTGDSSADG
jgi:hypothetical protein